MDPGHALGLWKSSFGPVKIEADDSRGASHVHGVWVYDRSGQEVVGYFSGALEGNVLTFTWQEPAQPQDLAGSGYLVFEPSGTSFEGRWWTANRDRGGEWTGSRANLAPAPGPDDSAPPDGLDDGMPPRGPDDGELPPTVPDDGASPPPPDGR
jgi:hypothetical protein